jgi:hypothetical protein
MDSEASCLHVCMLMYVRLLYTFPRRLFWRRWQPKLSKLCRHFFFYLVQELSHKNSYVTVQIQDFEIPAWRARSPIYIPREEGGPVVLPSIVFPSCPFIWHVGLSWRYVNPHPHGLPSSLTYLIQASYIASRWTTQKILFPTDHLLFHAYPLTQDMCLSSR